MTKGAVDEKIKLLIQASKAHDKRDYTEACRLYNEILDTFGLDPDVMWGLAQAEFALSIVTPEIGDMHGHNAIHWIKQALALKPDRPEYYYALGDMLEHVGAPNYEAAVRAYRRAIDLEPFYAPALSRLAMLYGVPEDVVTLEEAISCCERALRVMPTRSLWIVLARLYSYAGDEDNSRRALISSLLERHEVGPVPY